MLRWLFILVLAAPTLYAQLPDVGELEKEIESLIQENEASDQDLVQLAETIERLKENPIEVNFAQAEDLEKIPYLNVFQINNLLQYRKRTGPLYTHFELLAVKGFDRETIEQVLPYLDFRTTSELPDLSLSKILKYSRHDMIMRGARVLEEREGYKINKENGYLGPPNYLYLRYRWTYQNYLSIGFVAQQDAGEPFGKPYQKTGVDFIAGHIALLNYGKLKKLIIGDYQAQFGQGLALWSNLAFGKSAEAVEVKRFAQGFMPYTGSEENRFFRGAAVTYRFINALDVSLFYSNNPTDANKIVSDSTGTVNDVSSLQTTGLHRTLAELEDKNANRLQSYGANINYKTNNLSLGATVIQYDLQYAIEPGKQLYQKFRFAGDQLTNYSFDANYLFGNVNLFGELAADHNQNLAGTVGFQSNPTDGFYLTLLFRNIGKEYQALYNAPFAENGNYGEKGTYIGMQWQLNRVFVLKSYVDVYRFSWLKFGVNAPSRGYDLMGQLEMFFNYNFSAYIRIRNEVQEANSDQERPIPILAERSRSSLRIHFSYSLSRQWQLASRIQYAFYNQELTNDKGFVLFQDVRYTFKKLPFQLTTRIAMIDTDSYDARIYAYENDLTYAFSIPPYYGRSTRFYLLANYPLNDVLTLQAKYAISTFYDRDEISSGNQTIYGNTISELKLQLRIKL